MTEISQPIQITTTAPIPVADLKRKFTENVEFIIDVDNSRLKNRALITYLSNLNIQLRLVINDEQVKLDLLEEYLRSTLLVKIPDLEDLAMNICLAASGRQHLCEFDPSPFIEKNADIIETWLKRLYSLPLYALYCSPTYKAEVEKYPEDLDDGMAAINFVNLIGHGLFPLMMENIEDKDMTWNKVFFNDYVFAGSNLFKYFANSDNPFFVGLLAMEMPEESTAILQTMDSILDKSIQLQEGVDHVSPAQ